MTTINCKKALGMLICKVRATGEVHQSPLPPRGSIPLHIYTSKRCDLCHDMKRTVSRMNRNMGHPFNVKEIDIEKNPTPNNILTIPSITIGNNVIVGRDFDERTLLHRITPLSIN